MVKIFTSISTSLIPVILYMKLMLPLKRYYNVCVLEDILVESGLPLDLVEEIKRRYEGDLKSLIISIGGKVISLNLLTSKRS